MTDTDTDIDPYILIENLELKVSDLRNEVIELRAIIDRLGEVLRPTPTDPKQQRLDTV